MASNLRAGTQDGGKHEGAEDGVKPGGVACRRDRGKRVGAEDGARLGTGRRQAAGPTTVAALMHVQSMAAEPESLAATGKARVVFCFKLHRLVLCPPGLCKIALLNVGCQQAQVADALLLRPQRRLHSKDGAGGGGVGTHPLHDAGAGGAWESVEIAQKKQKTLELPPPAGACRLRGPLQSRCRRGQLPGQPAAPPGQCRSQRPAPALRVGAQPAPPPVRRGLGGRCCPPRRSAPCQVAGRQGGVATRGGVVGKACRRDAGGRSSRLTNRSVQITCQKLLISHLASKDWAIFCWKRGARGTGRSAVADSAGGAPLAASPADARAAASYWRRALPSDRCSMAGRCTVTELIRLAGCVVAQRPVQQLRPADMSDPNQQGCSE